VITVTQDRQHLVARYLPFSAARYSGGQRPSKRQPAAAGCRSRFQRQAGRQHRDRAGSRDHRGELPALLRQLNLAPGLVLAAIWTWQRS
jgi:hypothetical protein